MSKLEKVVLDYYNNREELRLVKIKISDVTMRENFDIDLDDIRSFQINEHRNWDGWENALQGDEYTDDQLEFCKLLDQKKEIISRVGHIKRAIYNLGRSLAKKGGSDE